LGLWTPGLRLASPRGGPQTRARLVRRVRGVGPGALGLGTSHKGRRPRGVRGVRPGGHAAYAAPSGNWKRLEGPGGHAAHAACAAWHVFTQAQPPSHVLWGPAGGVPQPWTLPFLGGHGGAAPGVAGQPLQGCVCWWSGWWSGWCPGLSLPSFGHHSPVVSWGMIAAQRGHLGTRPKGLGSKVQGLGSKG